MISLRRIALLSLIPVLGIASIAALSFLAARKEAGAISAKELVLLRQNQELLQLVQEAESKTLLDFDGILVVVDQVVVQDLLRAAAPLEGDVGKGFHVRIASADTAFGDGVALVRLSGSASLAGAPIAMDVAVLGALSVVAIDPRTGMLRCDVAVFGVEAAHGEEPGVARPLRQLSEALASGGLAMLLGPVEIPVRIADRIEIPAIDSKRLRIAASSLPLEVSVEKVRVFGGKLWIFLRQGEPKQAAAAPADRS